MCYIVKSREILAYNFTVVNNVLFILTGDALELVIYDWRLLIDKIKRYLSQRAPQLNRSQRNLTGQAESQSLLLNWNKESGVTSCIVSKIVVCNG